MVGQPISPSIDRRRLLLSGAVAVTSASIAPGVTRADFAAPDVFQSSQLTSKAKPANFSAGMARRLTEVARRNDIRREGKLPQLTIATELRRMKQQEISEEFERFEKVYGKAVRDEVLKPRQEVEGPNWRPSWMEGVSLQNQVRAILWEQFRAARMCA